MILGEEQSGAGKAVDSGQLVLETIQQLHIPERKIILIGSGNLALRGLISREIQDVDLLADSSVVKELSRRPGGYMTSGYYGNDEAKNTTAHLQAPDLPLPVSATVNLGWPHYPLRFYSERNDVEDVWGIPCLKLEDILRSKNALGREKDINDIATAFNKLRESDPSLEQVKS